MQVPAASLRLPRLVYIRVAVPVLVTPAVHGRALWQRSPPIHVALQALFTDAGAPGRWYSRLCVAPLACLRPPRQARARHHTAPTSTRTYVASLGPHPCCGTAASSPRPPIQELDVSFPRLLNGASVSHSRTRCKERIAEAPLSFGVRAHRALGRRRRLFQTHHARIASLKARTRTTRRLSSHPLRLPILAHCAVPVGTRRSQSCYTPVNGNDGASIICPLASWRILPRVAAAPL